MKRFHFPLESVQNLRLRQLETEEAKLGPIYRELEAMEQADAQIKQELVAEQARVSDPAIILRSFDLTVLDQFREFAVRRAVQLQWQKQNCQKRIQEQLVRIREAKQKHELLEKLREKELAEWNKSLNKELDALADEVFIAKWKPRRHREGG